MDVDNLRWYSVDILLSSEENEKVWKDLNFRKKIFSKCYLWDSYEDTCGQFSREHIRLKKEQRRMSEMRSMGYSV